MNFQLKYALLLVATVWLAGCGREAPKTQGTTQNNPTLSPAADIGKRLFFDTSLSGSGKLSCASCHDPAHAYGPPDGDAVRLGGANMDRRGTRAVPSLRYKMHTPLFSLHYYIGRGSDMEDEGPTGGFTQDGRVNTLAEQAAIPLLDANEMANESPSKVVQKVSGATYATQFKQTFGSDIFSKPTEAFAFITTALQKFQEEDPSFHPFSSKFDQVMKSKAKFSAAEQRGYALFVNPEKGNCAKCHTVLTGPGGRPPVFTDFGMVTLGVPRNPDIPANRQSGYFDLGLCGPVRKDNIIATRPDLCGAFKTPTLRNAAVRKVFFHNGRFHNLDDVLDFYFTRDTNPEKWYPKAHGKVMKFDDLPKDMQNNPEKVIKPFDRKPGQVPALNKAEIADLKAFLQTLTDADVNTN